MSKETYIDMKRDPYRCEKKRIQIWKETYTDMTPTVFWTVHSSDGTYVKRVICIGLFSYQIWKETYTDDSHCILNSALYPDKSVLSLKDTETLTHLPIHTHTFSLSLSLTHTQFAGKKCREKTVHSLEDTSLVCHSVALWHAFPWHSVALWHAFPWHSVALW